MTKTRPIALGLRENAGLFGVLVLMSAFVGAMVGFERSLLPELTKSWAVSETEAALLMVGMFGLSKAIANLLTGNLISEIGRKRTLLLGWAVALQALILLNSGDSAFIILANIALGLSQGFTWSTTVIMKIDIVGLKHRGSAMGLNESAGYVAVGLSSAFAAYYAETSGLISPILYTAMGIVLLASLITVFILPETQAWAVLEAKTEAIHQDNNAERIFYKTTWSDPALRTITWTGVVNNANDGVLWAVLPSLLLACGESLSTVGILTGIHAAVWGLGQLFTGPLSNNGKIRNLLWWGMSIQGLSLIFIGNTSTNWLPYILLGLGTAMVYPTFLVGISDHSHPNWRPKALSTYRFWRDMGYVLGAIIGYLALQLNAPAKAFTGIAVLTLLAGSMVRFSKLQ